MRRNMSLYLAQSALVIQEEFFYIRQEGIMQYKSIWHQVTAVWRSSWGSFCFHRSTSAQHMGHCQRRSLVAEHHVILPVIELLIAEEGGDVAVVRGSRTLSISEAIVTPNTC
jgi:hypothetical protein